MKFPNRFGLCVASPFVDVSLMTHKTNGLLPIIDNTMSFIQSLTRSSLLRKNLQRWRPRSSHGISPHFPSESLCTRWRVRSASLATKHPPPDETWTGRDDCIEPSGHFWSVLLNYVSVILINKISVRRSNWTSYTNARNCDDRLVPSFELLASDALPLPTNESSSLWDDLHIWLAVPKQKISRSKKRIKTTVQKRIKLKRNIVRDPRTGETTLMHRLPFNWKDYLLSDDLSEVSESAPK
jgi:ribosomal protein L32